MKCVICRHGQTAPGVATVTLATVAWYIQKWEISERRYPFHMRFFFYGMGDRSHEPPQRFIEPW
jgi:hypothetical protein